MSLYREPGRRRVWPAAVAAGVLVLALVVGFALGRASKDPSLEDVLALLTSAGFSGADALHIYRVLFGYLHGHILNELQEVIERPEETDDVLRLGLHRLTVTEFPHVRALASALANYDGAGELDRGLDLLLLGLTATLKPGDGPSRS